MGRERVSRTRAPSRICQRRLHIPARAAADSKCSWTTELENDQTGVKRGRNKAGRLREWLAKNDFTQARSGDLQCVRLT
jgi:hypothetical protein